LRREITCEEHQSACFAWLKSYFLCCLKCGRMKHNENCTPMWNHVLKAIFSHNYRLTVECSKVHKVASSRCCEVWGVLNNWFIVLKKIMNIYGNNQRAGNNNAVVFWCSNNKFESSEHVCLMLQKSINQRVIKTSCRSTSNLERFIVVFN
jgi:hypothetical protein